MKFSAALNPFDCESAKPFLRLLIRLSDDLDQVSLKKALNSNQGDLTALFDPATCI